MKIKRQIWKQGRYWLLAAGLLLTYGSGLTSCSDYDLDEKTPDGWGASIYSWLDEQGNYTNTVRLIDDLGYREVLSKTGSKTLFVADDEAFARFYNNRTWGASKYEDLTLSQKKLLLFGSMMDNSMQLSSLSSVEGNPPKEGEAMRRYASSSPFDSVTVLTSDKMPNNPYWKRYREQNKPMVCMTDNSQVPLIQFIEKQLANKRITNEDYYILTNKKAQRNAGDASINGIDVEEPTAAHQACGQQVQQVSGALLRPLSSVKRVDSAVQLSLRHQCGHGVPEAFLFGEVAKRRRSEYIARPSDQRGEDQSEV